MLVYFKTALSDPSNNICPQILPFSDDVNVIGSSLLPTQFKLPNIIKSDPPSLCGSESPSNKIIVPGDIFKTCPFGTIRSSFILIIPDQLVSTSSRTPET